jgi:DNA-binding Lrp family transcriptional regulator
VPKKIDDVALALMLGEGKTHQAIADELGVSRVAVTKRVAKLKETNPHALVSTSVEKFRDGESDQVAKARQYILNAIMDRITSPKGLNRESLPQLIKSFAILWDKDEKIQDRQMVKKVAVLHRHELDDETRKMLDDLIEHRTKQALGMSSENNVGDSTDNTIDMRQIEDHYEADISSEGPQSTEKVR